MALEIIQKDITPIPPSQPTERNLGQPIKWGSIFCGSFITVALVFSFMALGATIGLPSIIAINPMIPEFISGTPSGEGLTRWTWGYTLATFLISFFAGGYCSSRSARSQDNNWLYGIASWAVVITFASTLVSFLSPYMEQMLAGTIVLSANWLVFFIFALGALTSILGGYFGRYSENQTFYLHKSNTERIKTAL